MGVHHVNSSIADVFHVACLHAWATSLPPHTAPAGYTCILCRSPVIPQPNAAGPIAEALRATLVDRCNWARRGLGLNMVGRLIDR